MVVLRQLQEQNLGNGTSWTEVKQIYQLAEVMGLSAGAGTFNFGFSFSWKVSGYKDGAAGNRRMDSSRITDTIENDGQVFYRSDTGDMKVTARVYGTGAWATGNVDNTKAGNRASGWFTNSSN